MRDSLRGNVSTAAIWCVSIVFLPFFAWCAAWQASAGLGGQPKTIEAESIVLRSPDNPGVRLILKVSNNGRASIQVLEKDGSSPIQISYAKEEGAFINLKGAALADVGAPTLVLNPTVGSALVRDSKTQWELTSSPDGTRLKLCNASGLEFVGAHAGASAGTVRVQDSRGIEKLITP